MKKSIGVILLFMLPLFIIAQQSKSNCKVLTESLQGEYKGECKKGLAHGQGLATGKDVYEGKFKKGYPNGKGKYTWSDNSYFEGNFKKGKQNGFGKFYAVIDGMDSITEGYWDNDVYIGKNSNPKKYNTISKKSIERISYMYKGDGGGRNEVMVKFTRGGVSTRTKLDQIILTANSGDYIDQDSRFGFENITVPFKASLTFTAPTTLTTHSSSQAMNFCRLDFEILFPGIWEVIIYY